MKITKANVYDLENAVIASGYPKDAVYIERGAESIAADDYERADRLAVNREPGTGHDNFLKGVLVAADFTGTLKWWIQAQRYGHFTIVSSMSTMHRAERMPLKDACHRLPENIVHAIALLQDASIKGLVPREDFLYALPVGFEYTARVTTNYAQLKTIYWQRKTHRLQEWRDVCAWIETLPHAEWIVGRRAGRGNADSELESS